MKSGSRIASIVMALATSGCGLSALTGGIIASSMSADARRTDGSTPQPVRITTPAGLMNDRVTIQYALEDPASAAFDVRVEYSTDGAVGPFEPASEALGAPSQGTAALTVSAQGVPHVFVWNSFADLDPRGIVSSSRVVVRITAGQGGVDHGAPGLTAPFTVDNRLIATVVGPPSTDGEGVSGVQVPLSSPGAAAVSADGVVYVADTLNARVRRLDPITRLVTSYAGSGFVGDAGDGGRAVAAMLRAPRGIAVDVAGNLWIADTDNHRVRRVDATTQVIETVAGTGGPGYSGDGGPADGAALRSPAGIAVDASGRVFVADTGNHAVRMIDVGRTITTVVGTGVSGSGGDGGPAVVAQLSSPGAVWADGTALWIADTGNHAVRRAAIGGALVTVAGTLGTAGLGAERVAATTSALRDPGGVCVAGGFVWLSDSGNNRVRRFSPASAEIETAAGSSGGTAGFLGDDGLAASALLSGPGGLYADPEGAVLVADLGNNRVRRIDDQGVISTIMGSGAPDPRNVGDGGQALDAQLLEPFGMTVAADGGVYVTDLIGHRVRRFELGGAISTVAGVGNPGLFGDGGAATQALLSDPSGVTVDHNGIVFIADRGNNRVRAIDPLTGFITTVAGGGTGPDGVATLSSLSKPEDLVALPGLNEVLIAESGAHRVRRLTYSVTGGQVTSPVLATVCGTGVKGFSGDGGLATAARLDAPVGIDVDAGGWVYVVDQGGACVRRFMIGGQVETVAGVPATKGYTGDGDPATAARMSARYLAVDRASGWVYLAQQVNHVIRRFEVGGDMETISGNGIPGDTGDAPSLASATSVASPTGIAVDPRDGAVLFGTFGTRRIYRFVPGGDVEAVAGVPVNNPLGDGGPATAARVYLPLHGGGGPESWWLVFVEKNSGRLRRIDTRTGVVSHVVGQGILGVYPQSGTLDVAMIEETYGIAVGLSGEVYLAEKHGAIVRRVDIAAGTISPAAGTGVPNTTGDGGPAVAAQVVAPEGLGISPTTGDLYILDSGAGLIRRVSRATGIITTIAGGGTSDADGTLALSARLSDLGAVAIDQDEVIYIVQKAPTSVVRRFKEGGAIVVVAGIPGRSGYNGDNLLATQALLNNPRGIALGPEGDLFVADVINYRVRRVDRAGFITTVAGTGAVGSGPDRIPAQLSTLNGPRFVWVDPRGNVYVSEEYGNVIRRFRVFP